MEFLLSRYRNLTALLLAILAQLVLLAWQVKSNEDVRLIRVWSVTAVTPFARVLEFVREHTIGVAENYFVLVDVRNENHRLKDELGRLKLENHFLKTELSTADRAQALRAFQQRTPSRTLPARVIGTGTGANSRLVFIDQGSSRGVMRGMAVVTPDGIVGKVLAAYPTAAQVLLITDASFAAGVISEKNRVPGTLKGAGQSKVIVDYVQNEEKVEQNEMFYTSGDDRIFPKGFPVGRVTVVRPGRTFKDIFVVPSGLQHGLEEVLVVIEGVHGQIPDTPITSANQEVYIMPPPETPKPAAPATPAETGAVNPASPSAPAALMTDADRLRERYKRIGEAQGIDYGDPGKVPNFNANPNAARPPAAIAPQPGNSSGTPAPGIRPPAAGTTAPETGTTPAVTRPPAANNPAQGSTTTPPANRTPTTGGTQTGTTPAVTRPPANPTPGATTAPPPNRAPATGARPPRSDSAPPLQNSESIPAAPRVVAPQTISPKPIRRAEPEPATQP